MLDAKTSDGAGEDAGGGTGGGTAATGTHQGGAGRRRAGAKRPVLIVMHQDRSDPGHIGQWLRAQGFGLDIRRPALGCPLPGTLARHAGTVIFGGPMSANDDDDFLKRERDLVALALKEERPLLGVCLGAQLMARHLGARVYKDRRDRAEIGYYPIRPTSAGAAICDWPEQVYQWHVEGFDLPAGACLLATSDGAFPNQAYLYGGTAAGIQFHPEITLAMMHSWTTRAAHRFKMAGARPREEHLAGHISNRQAVADWIDAFLSRWVEARLPIG